MMDFKDDECKLRKDRTSVTCCFPAVVDWIFDCFFSFVETFKIKERKFSDLLDCQNLKNVTMRIDDFFNMISCVSRRSVFGNRDGKQVIG